jgi:putative ABC transport system substrate-binding protein
LSALAADLMRRRVAVIVAASTSSALAAKAATQTIPIVFAIGSDPVTLGLVASLNRPAGNLTGVAALSADMTTKRLALLHEVVPAIASIAMLVNPGNPSAVQAETKDLQSAARVLAVRVLVLNGGTESDIAAALLISSDTFFATASHQINSLAARYAIPTMVGRASVAAGGF